MRRHAIGMLAVAAAFAATAAPASAGITEFALPTVFSEPAGLAAGADGNVWVALPSSSRIARVTPAGVVTEFVLPAGREPFDVASSGGFIWFTERAGVRIGLLNPTAGSDSNIQASIVEFVVPGAASEPTQITPGPDGNVWFSEPGENQIGRITPAGTISEFSPFTGNSRPTGIAAGDGQIWTTQQAINRVARFSTSGSLQAERGIPTLPTSSLGSITAGSDGAMWFIDGGLDQVRRITITDDISGGFAAPTGSSLADITSGPDGALWLTEQRNGKILRLTTAGLISEYTLPSTAAAPNGIAVGPDGAIWFSERFGNKIGRITLDTPPDALPTGATGATGPAGPAGPGGPAGGTGAAGKLGLVAFQATPSKPKAGRKVTVRFVVTDAADVTLQVKRGRAKATKVATKKVRKAGVSTIAWNGKLARKAAKRGTYDLIVQAKRDGRTVSSRLRVKLR